MRLDMSDRANMLTDTRAAVDPEPGKANKVLGLLNKYAL